MRVDADITFDIQDRGDGDVPTVHLNDGSPSSVLDVTVNAFHNGMWTGKSAGTGTFYPARRLCSASVVYHTHCEHETCTKPLGKEHETHAAAVLDTEHTHVMPKPEPKPVLKPDEPKNKNKNKPRR